MRKLNRDTIQSPACLEEYDYHIQSWDDFGGSCKKQLRAALVKLQGIPGVTTEDAAEYGVRCAYCEGAIHHEGHIEHFRRKNPAHFPELTFEWTNLFLSCGSKKHCGHYKDRPKGSGYNVDDLLKPDIHDPDAYLFFHSSGKVAPRSRLEDSDIRMATETIRVFGLDNGTLPSERARAVKLYKDKLLDELDEIMSWEPEFREAYIQEEIESTQWQPYSTTIKHFLLTYC
ncbi:TIGR02646 family protein [Photobacterium damselae subsp. damselae]|uniref:retron system putative HNH endonuclease n=1 Tax=Photobacterium damselae TaxID=38293 RepID=UPI0010FE07C1|nr:retron system putative HNH endonuclease [Photobacterium damselae]TLS83012.1 TIGR02646 family protein [Photobacterium damselae subsp. damselae]TLS90518.1 TIGR02646 family protein [Photobacterium damselae subsp. damselae]